MVLFKREASELACLRTAEILRLASGYQICQQLLVLKSLLICSYLVLAAEGMHTGAHTLGYDDI